MFGFLFSEKEKKRSSLSAKKRLNRAVNSDRVANVFPDMNSLKQDIRRVIKEHASSKVEVAIETSGQKFIIHFEQLDSKRTI